MNVFDELAKDTRARFRVWAVGPNAGDYPAPRDFRGKDEADVRAQATQVLGQGAHIDKVERLHTEKDKYAVAIQMVFGSPLHLVVPARTNDEAREIAHQAIESGQAGPLGMLALGVGSVIEKSWLEGKLGPGKQIGQPIKAKVNRLRLGGGTEDDDWPEEIH